MRGQRFLDINEAIKSRRSERMLAAFGLTSMIEEPIYRERMVYDDKPTQFYLIERQALLVLHARYLDMKGGEH